MGALLGRQMEEKWKRCISKYIWMLNNIARMTSGKYCSLNRCMDGWLEGEGKP